MDIEHIHWALMAALHGIAAGKGLRDAIPTYGASVKIYDALNDAIEYLHEPFHADVEWGVIDQAFKRVGLEHTSDRKDEIAQALLARLRAVEAPRSENV